MFQKTSIIVLNSKPFLKIDYCFREFYVCTKIGGIHRDFQCAFYPPTCLFNIPHQSNTFVTVEKSTLIHNTHPNPIAYIVVHFVVHLMGEDKCINTGTHYYGITQNMFIALRIFCAPPLYPSPPQPLAVAGLLTLPRLPFLECHVLRIMQYCSLFRLASLT